MSIYYFAAAIAAAAVVSHSHARARACSLRRFFNAEPLPSFLPSYITIVAGSVNRNCKMSCGATTLISNHILPGPTMGSSFEWRHNPKYGGNASCLSANHRTLDMILSLMAGSQTYRTFPLSAASKS